MSFVEQPMPPELAAVVAACGGDPASIIALVQRLVEDHGRSSASVVNLVASHNRMSPTALAMMSSSVAEHIMSGRLGKREHAGGGFVDAIDAVVVQLSRALFHAEAVEYRAMSGALANGLALFALAQPGETILALPSRLGGHHSYREAGYAGARGLRLVDIPCEPGGAIDLDALLAAAKRNRPRAIVIGTAWMLEPYPVRELRAIADSVGAKLLYDGAHILGLVAGGQFQDPLREGAHVLTGSTQKTLGGPIGGLVLTGEPALGETIERITSGVIANYHNNRIAALAVTLAETVRFGRAFAAQTVDNARTLAQALAGLGVPVVGKPPFYTESHIVLVDVSKLPDGDNAFRRLEAARILTTRAPLPQSSPERRGLRLGTPAVTRSGMGGEHMTAIAVLVKRVLLDRENPARVADDAKALAEAFPSVHFC